MKVKILKHNKFVVLIKKRLKEEEKGIRWNAYIQDNNWKKPIFVSEGILGKVECFTSNINKRVKK